MAYEYTSNGRYPHWTGRLFLGRDHNGDMVGIGLEKHLVTVAGSGGGKGIGLIVQNARKWPASLLCLDPKEGENLRLSWAQREALGQPVYAIDPFAFATKDAPTLVEALEEQLGLSSPVTTRRPKAPHRLRARFNPLQEVDLRTPTAATELRNIADGMVVVHDPKHMEWIDGARDILAGLCAYVKQTAPPEYQTLVSVRNLLMELDGVPRDEHEEPTGLYADAIRMTACIGVGGLARSAGLTIQTALTSTKGMERDFLGLARRATKWLDDEAIQECLSASTFSLRELKKRPTSVYVVLHPDYLTTHAAFMRVFVQCAMNAMMKDEDTGTECLFILDEAYSLGAMERVKKAFTTTRHYGIHLWMIFQNLGQIDELYEVEGRETFFANSDALTFFENGKDARALDFIVREIGDLKPDEIASGPPRRTPFEPIPQPKPVPFIAAAPPPTAIYTAPPPPTQAGGRTHTRAHLTPPTPYQPGPQSRNVDVMVGAMFSGLAQLGHSIDVAADNAAAAAVEQHNRDLAAREANERTRWQHEVSTGEAKTRAANDEAMRRWQSKNSQDEAAHRAEQEAAMRRWHVQNEAEKQRHEAAEAEKQARFDFIMQQAYRPRQTPEEIRMLTSKREGEKWCRSMIVFAFANDILNVPLYPYFVEEEDNEKARLAAIENEERERLEAVARAEREAAQAAEDEAQAEYLRLNPPPPPPPPAPKRGRLPAARPAKDGHPPFVLQIENTFIRVWEDYKIGTMYCYTGMQSNPIYFSLTPRSTFLELKSKHEKLLRDAENEVAELSRYNFFGRNKEVIAQKVDESKNHKEWINQSEKWLVQMNEAGLDYLISKPYEREFHTWSLDGMRQALGDYFANNSPYWVARSDE